MNIQFNNYSPINFLKVENNHFKENVSFKSNESNEPVKSSDSIPSCSYTSVQIHPIAALNLQLLKDGYSMDEINEHSIFCNNQIKNIDFSNPKLLEAVMQGVIKKDDVFSQHLKSIEDLKAMQKAYSSLKEKFSTQDVRQHVAKFNKLEDEIGAFLVKKGVELPHKHKYSEKTLILSVLHYVNTDNEPLLQELLLDKTFNNVYLQNALMSIDKNKDMKYSMRVLQMAQEIGYKKEFSFPLAILISEANQSNIGMIEKMLDEQDFLSENDDFVSTKLMNFLRDAGTGLSLEYERSEDLSLNEVQELLELEELED